QISGAVDYDDLIDSLETVWGSNYSANALIMNPAQRADLAKLKSGDGSNSAALYMVAPPDVAALQWLTTNNCPEGSMLLGDFTNVLFGIRLTPKIELSKAPGFKKYQIAVRLVWRGDM